MNDFTKEELQYLEEAVKFHIEEDYQQNPALSVLNKIKTRIDNYCAHDAEIGKDYPAEKCMKCGRMWE